MRYEIVSVETWWDGGVVQFTINDSIRNLQAKVVMSSASVGMEHTFRIAREDMTMRKHDEPSDQEKDAFIIEMCEMASNMGVLRKILIA